MSSSFIFQIEEKAVRLKDTELMDLKVRTLGQCQVALKYHRPPRPGPTQVHYFGIW